MAKHTCKAHCFTSEGPGVVNDISLHDSCVTLAIEGVHGMGVTRSVIAHHLNRLVFLIAHTYIDAVNKEKSTSYPFIGIRSNELASWAKRTLLDLSCCIPFANKHI